MRLYARATDQIGHTTMGAILAFSSLAHKVAPRISMKGGTNSRGRHTSLRDPNR